MFESTTVTEQQSSSIEFESYWWSPIALQPFVVLSEYYLVFVFPLTEQGLPGVVSALAELGMGVALLTSNLSFVVTPLFPVALYLDAKAIRDESADWRPNPLVFGALGLLQFADPIATIVPFSTLVGVPYSQYAVVGVAALVSVGYLFKRHRIAEAGQ